jgi:ornithine cyclodeaminase
MTRTIDFAGTQIALISEAEVQSHLSLSEAIGDLRSALEELARGAAATYPRVRVEWRQTRIAWLHTLRAGISSWGIAGGKDYTSLGFDTPAMWATVINTSNGLPVAFIEADYLSRIRTAATCALATDLLAPPDADCLAHFGAGKISELLVQAIVDARPSLQRVLLVRRDNSRGTPAWLKAVTGNTKAEISDAATALLKAQIVTTATNSRTPVIPEGALTPRLRHINLLGSNHLKRREIAEDLARRCLPPTGCLVVDDPRQASLEAGDFVTLERAGELDWSRVPTLAMLLVSPELK